MPNEIRHAFPLPSRLDPATAAALDRTLDETPDDRARKIAHWMLGRVMMASAETDPTARDAAIDRAIADLEDAIVLAIRAGARDLIDWRREIEPAVAAEIGRLVGASNAAVDPETVGALVRLVAASPIAALQLVAAAERIGDLEAEVAELRAALRDLDDDADEDRSANDDGAAFADSIEAGERDADAERDA